MRSPNTMIEMSNGSCRVSLSEGVASYYIENSALNKNGHWVSKTTEIDNSDDAITQFNKKTKSRVKSGHTLNLTYHLCLWITTEDRTIKTSYGEDTWIELIPFM